MEKNNDIFVPDKTEADEALVAEIDCLTPPDEAQLEKIRSFLKREYSAPKVDFIIKLDPSVVGGFRMFVGDDNYDWTTLGRIRQLRKSFQALEKQDDRSKIISLLKKDIEDFSLDAGHQQVGYVLTVGDGIAVN